MTFLGIVKSNMNKLQSLLIYSISRLSCIKSIEDALLWYMILLSHSWPSKIRFNSQFGTRATPSNSMLLLLTRAICTVFTLLDYMIWPSTVVRSYTFGRISLIKRFQLFIKYQNAHKSKYHMDFVFDIIVNSIVIKAFSK